MAILTRQTNASIATYAMKRQTSYARYIRNQTIDLCDNKLIGLKDLTDQNMLLK